MPKEDSKPDMNLVAGLAIGSARSRMIAVIPGDGSGRVFAEMSRSGGIRRGVITNPEEAAYTVRSLADRIEERSGGLVNRVYASVSSSSIKSSMASGAASLQGKTVTDEDILRAIDAATLRSVHIPANHEILHVCPDHFSLDGTNVVQDPVGMKGKRLEVRMLVVTCDSLPVMNLVRCCEIAGIEIADIILNGIASAEAVITPEERQTGVVLADIGAGTTDLAVYRKGRLQYASVLPVGGYHFTNDLSVGLKVPFHDAERIKTEWGSLIFSEDVNTGFCDSSTRNGQGENIALADIAGFLRPRGDELLELIREEISGFLIKKGGLGGMVLTGGSAHLKGFGRLSEVFLSLPVRVGNPLFFSPPANNDTINYYRDAVPETWNDPAHAVVMGLFSIMIRGEIPGDTLTARAQGMKHTFGKMMERVKSVFSRNQEVNHVCV